MRLLPARKIGVTKRFPGPSMLRTHGLTHIAIAVDDVEQSVAFYQALLGAKVLYRDETKVEIGTPGASDVISIELGTSQAGAAASIRHFGFRLQTAMPYDEIAAEVERCGGSVVEKGEFVPGEPYVFARDPAGNMIELWYEPDQAAR